MIEECADNGRRAAICNWQHCGKKMSISYNGGTTNLIDHLVATHGFQRTPLKPPREDGSDSGSSSKDSKEIEKKEKFREPKIEEKDSGEVFIRSDKDYEFWGPTNTPLLPEPYVTYSAIRDIHSNLTFRPLSKVEVKGSDKWVILCLASQKSGQTSPHKIKNEKEPKDVVAFILNTDTKVIKKESMSKLKYLNKGTLSGEARREGNAALDRLPEWISKNDGVKKRQRENNLSSSQPIKKDPFETTTETNSGGDEKKKTDSRFASPDKKRQKKGTVSNMSTTSNPIVPPVTSPILFPSQTPPLSTTGSSGFLPNLNRMKTLMDDKNQKSLLAKRITTTIANPEPPQPLEIPVEDY
jgi:hypothetical protein